MASSAAHLITSNLARPSIFELIAAQSLDTTFYPAFKKIFLVIRFTSPNLQFFD